MEHDILEKEFDTIIEHLLVQLDKIKRKEAEPSLVIKELIMDLTELKSIYC